MSANDPTHPANVMKGAAIIQNQSAADTMYDPYPPKRIDPDKKKVEAFENPSFGGITLVNFMVIILLASSLYIAYRYFPKSSKSKSYFAMTLLASTISFALYKYITYTINNSEIQGI
jgi:hypothetical protein